MTTPTASADPALPGTLQATFVVEAAAFAWWGTSQPAPSAAALGLPAGQTTTLRVALPDPAARRIEVVEVRAVLVDASVGMAGLAAFAADTDPEPAAGTSLRVWSQLAAADASGEGIDDLVRRMPTAGHAAVGLDDRTVWSARAAVDAARRAAARPPADREALPGGALRPYQRAGVAWLLACSTHGGGVLADEMGLGKTLQAIAVLVARQSGPHLVVAPTTVVGTWRRELARFAPDVEVLIHRSPDRVLGTPDAGVVVLTSYGLLRSESATLAGVVWDVVVLDEAQQVKNPDTLAARAARSLHAALRIAMTGTPVENRLDDLWSLLAFTNPGLLGPRARFRRRFAGAIEQHRSAAAAARLHEVVGPHLLRRRKVDVAPELPDKIEATVWCALTDEQERRYRAALDAAFAGEGLGLGVARRGRVLALLTRLKMICNHPDHELPAGGRSGKLDRITEILAEIVDAGDRALVFTQYRRTGELLADHLAAEVTGAPVPFLHGGLSAAARETLIERFSDDADGPPVLVLSLRAAGFGLTLTRATHVVHYDRWWNPAVEDQAADRAHRIGQTRTVTVHTLVTERSVEEAVADLHVGKRELAGVVTGGTTLSGSTLARLSDEQLRALLDPAVIR